MEAARTSETLVNFYQTTRCYNPEDSHLVVYCLCIFVYCFKVQIVEWLRGPRLPVVIQWGSAEVKRLRTSGLDKKANEIPGSETCCNLRMTNVQSFHHSQRKSYYVKPFNDTVLTEVLQTETMGGMFSKIWRKIKKLYRLRQCI
jgi:hypothetical protein